MANTSPVYARVDAELKEHAENILSQLGITPSSAIQMLYSQIVLTKGLPFVPKLPAEKPASLADMTLADFNAEIAKGLASLDNGQTFTAQEIEEAFAKEFGV